MKAQLLSRNLSKLLSRARLQLSMRTVPAAEAPALQHSRPDRSIAPGLHDLLGRLEVGRGPPPVLMPAATAQDGALVAHALAQNLE